MAESIEGDDAAKRTGQVGTHQKVGPDEVLRIGGGESTKAAKDLTPTQRVGFRLAVGIGSVIALLIVFTCVVYACTIPPLPSLADHDPEAVARYQSLRDISYQEAAKFFDLTVTKALLPIFSSIAGFVLGSRRTVASNGD